MSAQTGMLDDIVDGLIRCHGIVEEDMTYGCRGWVGRVESIALSKARTLDPETLGRIIFANPSADLYSVHRRIWLGEHESGPLLLQRIAATVIVCRIRAKLGVASGVTEHAPHQTGEAAEPDYVMLQVGPGPHQHD